MTFKHCVRASQRRMRRRTRRRRRRTGIKGMQIGKNESCSLLSLLTPVCHAVLEIEGQEKRLLMPFGKKSAHFKGFTRPSTTTITTYGWWVGVPHHRRSSSAGLVSQNTFLCVVIVKLSLFRFIFYALQN